MRDPRDQLSPPVQTSVPVFQCTAAYTCSATPIALDASSTMTLVLYGTGLRNLSSVANAHRREVFNANGGTTARQPSFDGLDQGTLPVNLSGSGAVNIVLTVDVNRTSNVVTIDIQ